MANLISIVKKIKPVYWFLLLYGVYGVFALSQYGIGLDEITQKTIGIDNYRYIIGATGPEDVERDKYFGPVVELVINLIAENVTHASHVSLCIRHLLIWLFWILVVYYFYKLMLLLFQNPTTALLATILFACSPRLFAHAHYNSKDSVFLGLLLFSIYHIFTFKNKGMFIYLFYSALCLGVATSLRSVGALFALIFVFQLYVYTRKLKISSFYLLFFVLSLYAVYPYLWLHPITGPVKLFLYANNNPWPWPVLFAGTFLQPGKGVWYYVPLSLLITMSLSSLFMFGVFVFRLIKEGLNKQFNLDAWFVFNLFLLPMIYMVFTKPFFYNMGRHTLFFQLFISIGVGYALHALWKTPIVKKVVLAIVTLPVISLVAWFGNEMVYFNAVKTNLFKPFSFEMDYWAVSTKKALDYLLDTYPNQKITINTKDEGPQGSVKMFSSYKSKRVEFVDISKAQFQLVFFRDFPIYLDSTSIHYYGSKDEPYLIINKLNPNKVK